MVDIIDQLRGAEKFGLAGRELPQRRRERIGTRHVGTIHEHGFDGGVPVAQSPVNLLDD